MATRQGKKIRQKVAGRANAINESKRITSLKKDQEAWELANPELFDAQILLGLSFSKFVRNLQGFGIDSPQAIEDCILKTTSAIVVPYKKKMYGRCDIIKTGIEYWLHSKHTRGEMSLMQVGQYIGSPVNVNLVFSEPDHSRIPWSPLHHIGNMMWKNMLKIVGTLNYENLKVSDALSVFRRFGTADLYPDTMTLLEINNMGIHPSFKIEPGEGLKFEV